MMEGFDWSWISHRQRLVVQPDHGKAATLNWLDCFFGFVQLWWLRIDLAGKQGVGVEHAVLQQVGNHVRWITVNIFTKGFSLFGTLRSLPWCCWCELGTLCCQASDGKANKKAQLDPDGHGWGPSPLCFVAPSASFC